MGKRGTSFSEDSGLKFLSIGEVKVKPKAIASTQHFPFRHKLKFWMVQSLALREEAEMIHAPSHTQKLEFLSSLGTRCFVAFQGQVRRLIASNPST